MSNTCEVCRKDKPQVTTRLVCDECATHPPVRSESLVANKDIVNHVLDALLAEAQERFGCWSALTPEEVKAWINSRRVHWFATTPAAGREGKR